MIRSIGFEDDGMYSVCNKQTEFVYYILLHNIGVKARIKVNSRLAALDLHPAARIVIVRHTARGLTA